METASHESYEEIHTNQVNDNHDEQPQVLETSKERKEEPQPSISSDGLKAQAELNPNKEAGLADSERPHDQDVLTSQPGRASPVPSMLTIIPHSSEFSQIEAFLRIQLDKCNFYKKIFEEQNNLTQVSRFETYTGVTLKDLEFVRKSMREGGALPRFKFETVRVTCVPTNVDIKDKELQLILRTSNLPVATIYIIGEFDFPVAGKSETVSQTAERWVKNVKIEPKNIVCCSSDEPRQLEMIFSTANKPFYDTTSTFTEYHKPMEFYVERGRSRTFKRKFKPVRLTFCERSGLIGSHKKLGTISVKIDDINDHATLFMRMPILDRGRPTAATADIKVRVREPLVDKTLKTHEDKFLILT